MNIQGLKTFSDDIKRAVEEEKIPGAVLLAGRYGDILLHETCGWAQLLPVRDPMTGDTSFDIASLTKMTATWPAILKLLQEGKITLHDTLPELLDRPMHPQLKDVTLFNLLTHTAGLIPDCWPDRFGEGRDTRINGLLSLPLDKPLGRQVQYSDLSFIFLGAIVEKWYGKRQDLVAREIFDELGMKNTTYNPAPGTYCAATEFRADRDTQPVRGTVHDETSWMLDGVAGHAGVFSTAEDLGRFCAAIIPHRCHPFFEKDWLDKSFTNQTAHLGDNRCLGWIAYRERREGNIVGHTGFTGTSLWIDTVSGEYVVLLTNRVHPTRKNGHLFPLRREGFKSVFGVTIMV